MEYEIVAQPSSAMVKVYLKSGETISVESGSMVAMSGELQIQTKSRGLFRAMAAMENVYLNQFTAQTDASIWFAPSLPGDIRYITLQDKGLIVASSAYLAHHGEINQEIVWRGLKGFMGGGGLLWLRLRGQGGVWVNSCGAIEEKEVKPGEKLVVDNLHLVCMDDTLEYEVRRFGSFRSFFLGGEGFVFEVKGDGRLYLQTRNPSIYYGKSK